MLAIILSLYALFILGYMLVSFFVVYHLISYSINSHFSRILVSFFLLVSIFLLVSNAILFFSVDWKVIITDLIPTNSNSF